MVNMIDINMNKVCKSYGFDKVLNNISLTINRGEKVSLIGSNGCGKSTLLKIIVGFECADSGDVSIRNGVVVGYLEQLPPAFDILVKDYIYSAFDKIIEIRDRLYELEKNLNSDIKTINKYSKLQEDFINMGGYEFETKIDKVLAAFDINDEMLNRNLSTLSGGEKTICSLIRLLLIEPDILILDEPTNHLDIKRIEWLEKYLSSYNGTVIIVSHDRYFLDKVVNKTFLITKRGIEVYFGNYSYFVKENENRLMLEFKSYKDNQKIIAAMEKSIKKLREFARLCGDSGGEIFYRRAISIEKRLEKMEKVDKPDIKKSIPVSFCDGSRTGNDVLKIVNFNFGFCDKELFKNAKLDLFYKERVCLIGENGSGKSTLIKEILSGSECIKLGTNIKIGYIPQEIVFDDDNLSVLDEARKYFVGDDARLRSLLFKFLFVGENIYKRLKFLSGGEKVRLKLFCLTCDKCNFLILDEPTNHIDIDTREILENALNSFSGTILFVSHDRYFINRVANSIVLIDDRKMIKFVGNYDDFVGCRK